MLVLPVRVQGRRVGTGGAAVGARSPGDGQGGPGDVAFVADKAGAKVATLAGSVGVLPQASDYIALFDANVDALRAAAR